MVNETPPVIMEELIQESAASTMVISFDQAMESENAKSEREKDSNKWKD